MAQIDKKHLTSKNMADERQKIDLTNDKTFSKAPLTKDHGIRIAVHKSIEQQRIQKLTQEVYLTTYPILRVNRGYYMKILIPKLFPKDSGSSGLG